MAESIRFERMVHISAHDSLANCWFRPAHPTLHNLVGVVRLELTRLSTLASKTSVATNYTIPPNTGAGWVNRTLSILRSRITSAVQSHSAQAGVTLFTTKFGTPNEIRTRVTCVKGGCPRPLDDGSLKLFLLACPSGFEPLTLEVEAPCSIQLS